MILTSMRLAAFAQSAVVPVTVRVNVSQLTPSVQLLSPLAAPVPTAVPSQARGALASPMEPEGGLADSTCGRKRARLTMKSAARKNRVAAAARAALEEAAFFMGPTSSELFSIRLHVETELRHEAVFNDSRSRPGADVFRIAVLYLAKR